MATAPATKPEADAEEVAPTAAVPIQPTPTQAENDAFATQQAAGTLPKPLRFHKADGSPIDPSVSHDPSPPGAPTWP